MKTNLFLKRAATLALSMLIVLSVFAAALPRSAQAAVPAARCSETYTVKAGDTIYSIAKKYTVTAYRLGQSNDLKFPYKLIVGDELCIPEMAFSSPSAKWTATLTGTDLNLEGTGFKKQYTFFVRVRESDTATWYKLGKFQTTKTGELDDESFDLPKALQGKSALNVCLKDAVSDALVCKRVFRK